MATSIEPHPWRSSLDLARKENNFFLRFSYLESINPPLEGPEMVIEILHDKMQIDSREPFVARASPGMLSFPLRSGARPVVACLFLCALLAL
jgi:hypothetical protein